MGGLGAHTRKKKKKKVDQTYRVSWVKPKEHPYRLSALEISCSILQDKRISACFLACDGVGGDSSQSKFWLPSSCLNLQTVKLLVFQHSFKFAIHYGKHFHSLSPGFQITAPSREFASQASFVYSRWRKHCHKLCVWRCFQKFTYPTIMFCLLSTSYLDRFMLVFMSGTLLLQTMFQ